MPVIQDTGESAIYAHPLHNSREPRWELSLAFGLSCQWSISGRPLLASFCLSHCVQVVAPVSNGCPIPSLFHQQVDSWSQHLSKCVLDEEPVLFLNDSATPLGAVRTGLWQDPFGMSVRDGASCKQLVTSLLPALS